MSKTIAIMGESGSGKTTSMRNLDPQSTFYFDCDRKGLSWKGWKSQYNSDNKNYYKTSDITKINSMLGKINNADEFANVKTVIIDTGNAIMIDDEMSRIKETGYDKWQDLAISIWSLITTANIYRDDLTIIFTFHCQVDKDELGNTWTRIKTSGKKIDKMVIESKFTTVLLSKCVDDKYVFETNSNYSTAKSPMGAFEEKIIDNDIVEVIKALEEF